MRTNPCTNCLVNPCCTEICNDKHIYTEEILSFLCRLGMRIYDKNGKKVKGTSDLLMTTFNEAAELSKENNKQHNDIINRYVGRIVY